MDHKQRLKKGIFFGIAAVLLVAVIAIFYFRQEERGEELLASVHITASKTGETGVLTDTDFAISADRPLEEAQLRQILNITPDISYQLSGGGTNWLLSPLVPLERNTVYAFRVTNDQNEVVQSFAFQTESDLMLRSSYPRDGERYVDPTTGIDLTFNASGLQGLAEHVSILPEVSGSWLETEYGATFIPDEPLADNTVYQVTVSAGVTAANGMQLEEDVRFRFETTVWDDGRLSFRRYRDLSETFLPGDPLAVGLSVEEELLENQFHVTLRRYDSTADYIADLEGEQEFEETYYGPVRSYAPTHAGDVVREYDTDLYYLNPYFEQYILLPEDLEEGSYLVEISTTYQDSDYTVHKMIQLQNTSVYHHSLEGQSTLWLNDPATGQPMEGVEAVLQSPELESPISAVTDENGLAHFETSGLRSGVLTLQREGQPFYAQQINLQASHEHYLADDYLAYVYLDRNIYQPTDTLHFWGVIRPQHSGAEMPRYVYAAIPGGYGTTVEKLRINVEEDGTFQGEIPLESIRSDYYSLDITDGTAQSYCSNYFEVRAYQKPAYVIDVTTAKEYYRADEEVQFLISAEYYDGTPVSGMELLFQWDSLPNGQTTVTLDAEGKATLTAPADIFDPDISTAWWPTTGFYQCYSLEEQGNYYTSVYGYVDILPSRYAAKAEFGEDGTVTLYTALFDESRMDESFNEETFEDTYARYAGQPADLAVSATLIRTEYVQVPMESYFDRVNNKTIHRYETKRQSTEVETYQVTTSGGQAVLDLPELEEDRDVFYQLEVTFDGGLTDTGISFAESQPHENLNEPLKDYSLRDVEGDSSYYTSAAQGQTLQIGLFDRGSQVENTGRLLYLVTQQDIMQESITDEDTFSLTFTEEMIPNVQIFGAYFDGRHIYSISSYEVDYQYDEKVIDLSVTADQESYLPGEEATIRLEAKDASGSGINGTALVSVVDEAVFAVVPQELDLAHELYLAKYFAYPTQTVSYQEYNLEANPDTGGGMGGGGGDGGALREHFPDTALFQTVELVGGSGEVTFTLPDNITSWRITAAAVDDTLRAGSQKELIISTKEFYLNALTSLEYLEGDDVTVSAIGVSSQHPEEEVEYSATLTSLGDDTTETLTATGRMGRHTAFQFGQLPAGQYSVEFSGSTLDGQLTDALKVDFSVAEEGVILPVTQELATDQLEEISATRYPVYLTLYDQELATYVKAVTTMRTLSGERTEAMLASDLADSLYYQMIGQAYPDRYRAQLDEIYYDTAIRELPHGDYSPGATARLLVAAPNYLSVQSAADYLWQVMLDPASNREDIMDAYMGLAAAGEPVMLDIQRILAEDASLSRLDRLKLGCGLAAIGDQAGAQQVLDAVSEDFVREDDRMYLDGGSRDGTLQETGAALMLASIVGSPDAEQLMNYLLEEIDITRDQSVVPYLEMMCYLNHFQSPASGIAEVSYHLDGKDITERLGGLGRTTLLLGAGDLETLDLKVEHGKVMALASYDGRAANANLLAENDQIRMEKAPYEPMSGEALTVGQMALGSVEIQLDADAPEGRYEFTLRLSSGMRYLSLYDAENGQIASTADGGIFEISYADDQLLRGSFYYYQEEDGAVPLTDEAAAQENPDTSGAILEEPAKPSPDIGGGEPASEGDGKQVSFQFLASCVLPGEFIDSPLYLAAPDGSGYYATDSGSVEIAPRPVE